MQSSLTQQKSSSDSTTHTREQKYRIQTTIPALASIWWSLKPRSREMLWKDLPSPAKSAVSSLHWMWYDTKTRDDQNPEHPYKPFPRREYFQRLHELAERESILFIEKSRTMMMSWWAVAEDMHYVMTHPPATVIFWAQDQDRSVVLRDYAWVLWENSHPAIKESFPVLRPRERQAFNELEFKSGAKCLALPGKDPDKIRSLHPTRLIMDEACFIENGGEAFDVAISSKVPKVKVISSAAPGWFRMLTKPAIPDHQGDSNNAPAGF